MRTGELRRSYSHAQRELVDMVMSTDLGYNAILALYRLTPERATALYGSSENDPSRPLSEIRLLGPDTS
jgi:hypothetical protein